MRPQTGSALCETGAARSRFVGGQGMLAGAGASGVEHHGERMGPMLPVAVTVAAWFEILEQARAWQK